MNLEDKLVTDLENNEHIIHILPADELFQEWVYQFPNSNEVKKYLIENKDSIKGKIVDYGVPAKDLLEGSSKILMDFGFPPTDILIKEYAGKQYVIFKGNPRLRKVITGTRYLVTNPKVVRMAIGPKGIQDSVKTGFAISVLLSVGIEIFNYCINDEETMAQLLGTIHSDLIKIGISSIAAAVAGTAAVTIVGGVLAPFLVAVAVGVVVGATLNIIDNNIGATRALIQAYEDIGLKLREIKYEINRTVNYLDRHPESILCIFGPCGGIVGY